MHAADRVVRVPDVAARDLAALFLFAQLSLVVRVRQADVELGAVVGDEGLRLARVAVVAR